MIGLAAGVQHHEGLCAALALFHARTGALTDGPQGHADTPLQQSRGAREVYLDPVQQQHNGYQPAHRALPTQAG
ncbi:hypothetical protein LLH03_10830 [bacterium]|nr:hypothetical protein [bacterium]